MPPLQWMKTRGGAWSLSGSNLALASLSVRLMNLTPWIKASAVGLVVSTVGRCSCSMPALRYSARGPAHSAHMFTTATTPCSLIQDTSPTMGKDPTVMASSTSLWKGRSKRCPKCLANCPVQIKGGSQHALMYNFVTMPGSSKSVRRKSCKYNPHGTRDNQRRPGTNLRFSTSPGMLKSNIDQIAHATPCTALQTSSSQGSPGCARTMTTTPINGKHPTRRKRLPKSHASATESNNDDSKPANGDTELAVVLVAIGRS
mmetsp:Transcript_57749/g.146520  ORF Transcript_57749/g.146520 Transcript_57749/m.146520 type:complete len:258 (+) Transcript_57749:346-1119(+)